VKVRGVAHVWLAGLGRSSEARPAGRVAGGVGRVYSVIGERNGEHEAWQMKYTYDEKLKILLFYGVFRIRKQTILIRTSYS